MSTSEPSSGRKKKRRGGPRRKTGMVTHIFPINDAENHTCKTRHSRCDEKKPICGNCERLDLECKPSEFIARSKWTQNSTPPTQSKTVGEPHDTVGETLSEGPSSTWDIFRTQLPEPNLLEHDSPPNDFFASLSLSAPVPTGYKASNASEISLTPETAFLLQTYLRTVAQWQDLFDFDQTHQLSIPRLTISSPILFHGVCALSSKQLAFSHHGHQAHWHSVASHHYGQALQLLISSLGSSCYEHALTATIILLSFEMLASIGSDHRRHLLGAMMLIKSQGISAQSVGIDRANFWIYIRHEIGVALTNEKPLMLRPEEWNVQWVGSQQDRDCREDMVGNHVLWIVAKTIDLVFGKENNTEVGTQQRTAILRELEDWRAGLTDTFIGIPYGDQDEDGFQKTYFTVTVAAAAAFWYHVAHILLYAEPVLQHSSYDAEIQDHAMKVTNIALSEFPDALRVFASHGLFYAAKHIKGIARKARIWNILNDVETQLGYHTRSIVKRLQELLEEESGGT
ncbi:hypothetical protein P154DRAFT_520536 [Amniculicola lignicola CBS 123094]|uniref:Zn(2)-C6 fungal-type domain-containing protein n=1 Tax=Amniculicola lignicola CBS 123094 TaxID=1392246 RepID=A0A6A5WMM9_9PLEO|nr:hypothetical protein P154DRAFT_520536 [Amniculicola lignicola CBS 123094]